MYTIDRPWISLCIFEWLPDNPCNSQSECGIAVTTLHTPVQCLFAGSSIVRTGQKKVQKQD